MRVLIAEDETIIRLDVRTLLERAGHEVVAEARDGEEAVALAAEHEPDLVIMDVRMPHLDGIEAARAITDRRPVPIVMLTAYAEQDLVTRASEAGCVDNQFGTPRSLSASTRASVFRKRGTPDGS